MKLRASTVRPLKRTSGHCREYLLLRARVAVWVAVGRGWGAILTHRWRAKLGTNTEFAHSFYRKEDDRGGSFLN